MAGGVSWNWRLPLWAYLRFQELVNLLEYTDVYDDEAYTYRDEIRSLPGFPREAHPDRDLIYFEITDRRH